MEPCNFESHITPFFSTTHSVAASTLGGLQRPSMSWLRSPVSMPACTPACVLVPGLPCPPPGFRPQLIGLSSLRHADMPSQHQGYVRRPPVPCRAGSRSSGPWKRTHILVDSGSQQPPLICMEFASTLGVTMGPSRTGAAQAGGAAIPIYDVGPLHLAVNGTPSTEMFCVAPITPYDVILGESWLLKHGVFWITRGASLVAEVCSMGSSSFSTCRTRPRFRLMSICARVATRLRGRGLCIA